MKHQAQPQVAPTISRRQIIAGTVAAVTTANRTLGGKLAMADTASETGDNQMEPKAFVYTELQTCVPSDAVPWQDLNDQITKEPDFLNNTWFSGAGNNSVGGLYSFDSVETAQHYCTSFFPMIAKKFGAAQTSRVFDASLAEAASLGLRSPYHS